MNENIKRLAEDAGFVLWANEEWNPGETIDWASNYDAEIVKYTELVVRACLHHINDVDVENKVLKNFGIKND